MKKRLKVLYLTPSVKLLGARRSLLALVRGLSPEFEPMVVAPSDGGLTKELRAAGIDTHVIRLYQWRKGKFFFHRYVSVEKLRAFIDRTDPDIVHCNEFFTLPYAVKATHNKNIPIITHIRLNITERQIRNYFLHETARIITVSKALAQRLESTGLEQRTRVVYNAIEPHDLEPDGEIADFREETGIAKTDILVGHIGGIEPRKRQHITLRAARKVIDRNPSVRFVFVGNPRPEHKDYYHELQNTAKNLAIEDNVFFIPFRDDIVSVYEALDINLLISAAEGFGRTIIEAGYLGVPSIGTTVGGIPELIEHETTGYLVNLDEVEQLAHCINDLAVHPEKRRSMGEAARERVKNNFLLPAHCRAIEEIYRECT